MQSSSQDSLEVQEKRNTALFCLGTNPEEFAETRVSRFAVDIAFYMVIALAQWIITVLIVEKIADPFRNFMDLCSVANISVLAFTHPLRAVRSLSIPRNRGF